jgi:hypothetical protein
VEHAALRVVKNPDQETSATLIALGHVLKGTVQMGIGAGMDNALWMIRVLAIAIIPVVKAIGVATVIVLRIIEAAMEAVLKRIHRIRVFAVTRAFHRVAVAQMTTAPEEENAFLGRLAGIVPPAALRISQSIAAGLA